jgi:nickel transport protein
MRKHNMTPIDWLRWAAFLLVLSGTLFQAAPAWAHKLFVFAAVRGKVIEGEVYYQGGDAARDIKMTVLGPDGAKLAEATTDQDGKFSYEPRFLSDHKLVADAGFGHRTETTVPAAELPQDLPLFADGDAGPAVPEATGSDQSHLHSLAQHVQNDDIQALAQQIRAMRQDLDKWKAQLRMQDLLGGVGYILGLMGLASYLLRKRSR